MQRVSQLEMNGYTIISCMIQSEPIHIKDNVIFMYLKHQTDQ